MEERIPIHIVEINSWKPLAAVNKNVKNFQRLTPVFKCFQQISASILIRNITIPEPNESAPLISDMSLIFLWETLQLKQSWSCDWFSLSRGERVGMKSLIGHFLRRTADAADFPKCRMSNNSSVMITPHKGFLSFPSIRGGGRGWMLDGERESCDLLCLTVHCSAPLSIH